jgi:hypothetical protein
MTWPHEPGRVTMMRVDDDDDDDDPLGGGDTSGQPKGEGDRGWDAGDGDMTESSVI